MLEDSFHRDLFLSCLIFLYLCSPHNRKRLILKESIIIIIEWFLIILIGGDILFILSKDLTDLMGEWVEHIDTEMIVCVLLEMSLVHMNSFEVIVWLSSICGVIIYVFFARIHIYIKVFETTIIIAAK